jgi:hypothetical protein
MIDFEIWLKLWQFHFILTPQKVELIRIKNDIFRYWIDWHKPEPKPKQNPIIDDDFDPIPF